MVARWQKSIGVRASLAHYLRSGGAVIYMIEANFRWIIKLIREGSTILTYYYQS